MLFLLNSVWSIEFDIGQAVEITGIEMVCRESIFLLFCIGQLYELLNGVGKIVSALLLCTSTPFMPAQAVKLYTTL